MLSRRTFLLAAGAAVVLSGGAFAAVDREDSVAVVRALGLPTPSSGADHPSATFASTWQQSEVRWIAAAPKGLDATNLPVVLALHAKGGDARSVIEWLGVDEALQDHVDGGGKPFVVVAVDGGSDSFWHARSNGTDPQRMITDELLPRLRQFGLRTERVGVMGWSMGGLGALSLARESQQGRLGGTEIVAAVSTAPALWTRYEDTMEGAFDDSEQFARWGDLISDPGVGDLPLRVDSGDDDDLADAIRVYRAAVQPTPAGGFVDGAHDAPTWKSLLPAQMDWLASNLP